MPNLYTALGQFRKEYQGIMNPSVLEEVDAALKPSRTYPGIDTKLLHPLDEEALDTIDAKMFTGEQSEDELQRIEYFCRRWLERCEESRRYRLEE